MREVGLFHSESVSKHGCFSELGVYTVTYGQVSWFIPRIELKEMENKLPMETTAEEGGQSGQRKSKLKDQSDKEEGVRGRSMVSGYNLSLFTTYEPSHTA